MSWTTVLPAAAWVSDHFTRYGNLEADERRLVHDLPSMGYGVTTAPAACSQPPAA